MSTLIQLTDIEKSYGARDILNKASLVVNKRQKIGVIGRNGAGKSTLFKLITGDEELDGGEISIYPQTQIGYLEQHDPFEPHEKMIDFLVRYTKKESWVCAKIAAQFQLKDKELNSVMSSFSGGYQMRVKVTAMLLQEPNLLLLDEPTNFLDLSTLLLLEKFLESYKGSYMIVSHDREFLKRTCTATLDVEHGKLVLHNSKQQKHLQKFVDRFRSKASKASQAQSKIKQLHKLKPIEIEHALARVRIKLPRFEKRKGLALEIQNMTIGYPDKIVAENISFMIDHGEHIAIVGDNGQGKTTFLKTLINQLQPIKGSFHLVSNTHVGYYAQHVPRSLDPKLSVYDYLHKVSAHDVSRENILEMAGNFLFRDDDLKKKIQVLSGGEKARLCLAGLLLQKHNCLFLDEPSNHLDFETVEALAAALQSYNGTILFISHNRTFVHMLATGVVEVKNGKVARYHGDYDHYVFRLEQKMLAESRQYVSEIDEVIEEKVPKVNRYLELKLLRKRLRKIEKEMVIFEKEKKELHDWFKKNPTKYDTEKYTQIQDVEKKIEDLEGEWLEVQEGLEK